MAKITNFNEEREKRRSDARERQDQAEQKIARHKLFRLIRILVIITILVGTGIFMYVRYRGKIYVGYDVINSVERTKVDGAKDVKLGNSVLTYSRDGAHSVDVKGVMTWNQSFEIQDIQLAICRNVCAICGYNGHEIFVQSSENQLGQIQTNLPIKNLTVAATGRVTAVLEDTNVMWLNTYEPSGQNIYEGQFHMSQSGYPCAISLSPNGDLLAVSFIFVEEGSYAFCPSDFDEDGNPSTVPTYNAYGDYTLPRPNASFSKPVYGLPVRYTVEAFTNEPFAESLNAVHDRFLDAGIRVYFSYAPRNIEALSIDSTEENRALLDAFFRRTLHARVISDIEDSLFSGVYMYGTDNHLSTEGVGIYTQRLIRDLQAAFTDEAGL